MRFISRFSHLILENVMASRQRSMALAFLLFCGTSAFGLSSAFAFGDDGGILQTTPSPLINAPECKVASGLFQIPVGFNDARNPLSNVGKAPKNMLSREFQSDDLVQIPYENTSPEQVAIFAQGYFERLRAPAARAVLAMINAARDANILLAVHSGFRDYTMQCGVFNHKIGLEFKENKNIVRGNKADEASVIRDVNTRSALPGQSEHQLGTALDIVTDIPGMGWKLEPEMDQTPAFAWLQVNAYKFGFVLSYPKGPNGPKEVNPRTGYVYEPWHWRYVGIVPAGRYQICKAQGMTTQEFLRALNLDAKFVCATNANAGAATANSIAVKSPLANTANDVTTNH
jgi:LAS superfamily LD-carboxypeptidase LdcB